MKKHRFKVFRATTRFKRFNIGLTRVVRRLNFRQKRRTNFLALSYITASWLNFFLKSRQFYRFVQAYGTFTLNAYSASVYFVSKSLTAITAPGGVNSYACSNKLISAFLFGKGWEVYEPLSSLNQKHFLESRSGYATHCGIMTQNPADHEVLAPIGPSAARFDRLSYAYDAASSTGAGLSLLQDMHNSLFNYNVAFVKVVRSVLILSSLKNIHNKNDLN